LIREEAKTHYEIGGMNSMEPVAIAKQMINLQKATFDNGFGTMVMLQEQTERAVNMVLQQAVWFPEEGKKVLGEWTKVYKQGRDDFRKAVNENFKKAETFFAEGEKVKKGKTD
jgi:hypothetical protein